MTSLSPSSRDSFNPLDFYWTMTVAKMKAALYSFDSKLELAKHGDSKDRFVILNSANYRNSCIHNELTKYRKLEGFQKYEKAREYSIWEPNLTEDTDPKGNKIVRIVQNLAVKDIVYNASLPSGDSVEVRYEFKHSVIFA